MGIKIVKGIAGQYEALKSPANQINQSKNSSSLSSKASQAIAATGDAAISLVRGGRSDAAERLSLEKAEKLAKNLKDDIVQAGSAALDAVGDNFSMSAVRDAFGV